MLASPLNAQKQKVVLELLDLGLVMIHLDPRAPGVVVPPQFHGDLTLRLNLAYGFNLPSLDVDDDGIYAVLSFGGRDFGCSVPWESVYAATLPDEHHKGMVWPGSLPPEGDPLFDGPPQDIPANAPVGDAPPGPQLSESRTHHRPSGTETGEHRSPFSVIQGGAGSGEEPEESPEASEDPTLPVVADKAKSRPVLRLVED